MALFKANALFLELGEAPDSDAITYINANNITRLEQQAGICSLVKFLKDKSLWTTLAGGFLFGNRVGASSGTSLPDLKGGTAATLTGGSHEVNGIYMNGNNADEISFGARTFTNNYMPSVYLLFASYNKTGTTSSNRITFSPLTSNSTYRGFQPHTHNQTGSATLSHLQVYRGDGNRYVGSDTLNTGSLNALFVGAAFSSSNQLVLGGQNASANNSTSTIAAPMTFSAGATWFLGPFEGSSKTSTELTTVSACLFWNSDTALTPQFVSQLDSLLRKFVC
jgi:hypothetical protein